MVRGEAAAAAVLEARPILLQATALVEEDLRMGASMAPVWLLSSASSCSTPLLSIPKSSGGGMAGVSVATTAAGIIIKGLVLLVLLVLSS